MPKKPNRFWLPGVVLGVITTAIGCSWLEKGTGKLAVVRPITSLPSGTTLKAGAVAIGEGIVADLAASLLNAGLTQGESQVILDSTRAEIIAAAGAIAVQTLALADSNPIIYVAAPAVNGAIKALDEQGTNLTDLSRRANIAQVVMASTVGSLGGRTSGLSTEQILKIQKDMVGTGVKTLTDGGLGGDSAVTAVKAITSGATSSLAKSVDNTVAAEAAARIVSGAVENLGSAGMPSTAIQSLVSSAVEGVVGQLGKVGVSDAAEAASLVAKSSVTSLKVLSLPVEKIIEATEGAAKGAVAALTVAGVSKNAIAAAAQKVATSSASALKTAGVPDDSVGKAAGAIASGAIQGLGAAGLSSTEIAATNSVKAIVSGASSGVAATGLASDKISSALGDVAGTAITAISKLSTSVDSVATIQDQIVSEIIQGTIAQAISQGIATSANISSITSTIATGAGSGLATLAKAGVTVTNTSSIIQSATQTVLTQEQSKIGLDSSTIQSVAASTGQTAEAAKTVATNTSNSTAPAMCASTWPDTMTNEIFKNLMQALKPLPACQIVNSENCPKTRFFEGGIASWSISSASGSLTMCQFIFTPTEGSAVGDSSTASSSTQNIVACDSLLTESRIVIGPNEFQNLTPDPNDTRSFGCLKPQSSDCPSLDSTLYTWSYGGPSYTPVPSPGVCRYFMPLTCTEAFAANPSYSVSGLIASQYSDELGDLDCDVSQNLACPTLTGSEATYQSNYTDRGDGKRACHYRRVENSCVSPLNATLVAATIDPSQTSSMTPLPKSWMVGKACRLTSTNPPLYFLLEESLRNSDGYLARSEFRHGVNRLVLRKNNWTCPIYGDYKIGLKDLSWLISDPISGEKSCDLPSHLSTCPSLADDAASSYLSRLHTYSNPSRTRCFFYPKTIQSCSNPLLDSDLFKVEDYHGELFVCSKPNGGCPAPTAGSIYAPVALDQQDSGRCIYHKKNIHFSLIHQFLTALKDQPFSYYMDAYNHQSGDPLVYSVGCGANCPAGLSVSSYPQMISWTPTVGGDQPITVTVSNSYYSVSQSTVIRVYGPTLDTISPMMVYPGQTLNFTLIGHSPVHATLTYSLHYAPQELGTIYVDPGSGAVSWTATADMVRATPYSVTFQVSDGYLFTQQQVQITVSSPPN